MILVGFLTVPLHAATPPALTGLMPSGGQRGAIVEVTAIGSFDTWPIQFWSSSPHLKVTPGAEKGKLAIAIAAEAPPGVYFLRGYDASGASGLRPFIVGTLPEKNESEPNDQLSQAQRITEPTVINGKLQRNGDVDCFAVDLKQGQTLVASVESHHTLRYAGDLALQLVLPNGTVIAQNHDYHGLDPQIAYTATQPGTVIVRLFAFPANPDSSIRFSGGELYLYRLTLTTGAFADSVRPLAMQRGKPGPLRLIGWNLDPKTSVGQLQPEGTVYHPQAAGVAPLRLEPHPTFDAIAGVAASYQPPASVTGQLTSPQPFRVKFALKKAQKYTVQIVSESLGLELDPVLTIRDPAGQQALQLQLNELHSELSTPFAPAADGLYALEVKDLHGRHGERQAFLLRVVPEAPDFQLSLASDRFTITPGKPLEIPLKLTLTGGHSGKIEIKPTGLPASVKTSTTLSSDQKTITLKLEAGAELTVPFGIVGTSVETPDKPQHATVALAELPLPVKDLWLTATPAPQVPGKK